MYYKEYLRARGAFITTTIVLAALLVFSLVGMAFVPHETYVGTPLWPAALAVASLVGAILATCLGCTLSQENDHLELAATKPTSRVRYATTVMAIDMAAILLSVLVAFVFIVIHYAIGHGIYHFNAGPDAVGNMFRFLLFPLAWYALIAAFSAGLRSKAGIVQGLIWPVAIVLVALREAPFQPIWHNLFVAINSVNPLILVSYHDRGDVVIVGTTLNVTIAAVTLAALVVVGWFAATVQWRRVEA
jgi:hypothetical protein